VTEPHYTHEGEIKCDTLDNGSIVILSVVLVHAKCHNKPFKVSVVMLSVIMLSVVMLNVLTISDKSPVVYVTRP
jgi:hypothetical protein